MRTKEETDQFHKDLAEKRKQFQPNLEAMKGAPEKRSGIGHPWDDIKEEVTQTAGTEPPPSEKQLWDCWWAASSKTNGISNIREGFKKYYRDKYSPEKL